MACTMLYDVRFSQSYYDGNGTYQDLYDKTLQKFPRNPCKYNTTPAQNFLGLIAFTYVEYHENGIHPWKCIYEHAARYNLSWLWSCRESKKMLHDFLNKSDDILISRRLDKLMDLGIFCAYYEKPTQYITQQLQITCSIF